MKIKNVSIPFSQKLTNKRWCVVGKNDKIAFIVDKFSFYYSFC